MQFYKLSPSTLHFREKKIKYSKSFISNTCLKAQRSKKQNNYSGYALSNKLILLKINVVHGKAFGSDHHIGLKMFLLACFTILVMSARKRYKHRQLLQIPESTPPNRG